MATKAYYRQQLVDLRLKISKEREAKKRDNANYSDQIRRATGASSKASLRKTKISRSDYHNRQIESTKRQIESVKRFMKTAK